MKIKKFMRKKILCVIMGIKNVFVKKLDYMII